MNNGVIIKDPATTFIDAEVDIAKNVVIEPFNSICGDTIIESNVVLKSNNKIENSVVCEKTVVEGSVIKDSFVGKNCFVFNGSVIKNQTKVCDNVKIPSYAIFDGVVVEEFDKLSSFVVYKPKEE